MGETLISTMHGTIKVKWPPGIPLDFRLAVAELLQLVAQEEPDEDELDRLKQAIHGKGERVKGLF